MNNVWKTTYKSHLSLLFLYMLVVEDSRQQIFLKRNNNLLNKQLSVLS